MNLISSVFKRVLCLALCVILSACATKRASDSNLTPQQAEKAIIEASLNTKLNRALELLQKKDALASELQEAKSILLEMNQTHPYYAGPLVNLGLVSKKLRQFDEASTYFEKVLELDSPNQQFKMTSLNALAIIAREQGRFDDAESYYRKVLDKDVDNKAAIRNLAILLDLYRGRIEEALPLYERYQALTEESDSQVKDWIFDIKSRIKSE